MATLTLTRTDIEMLPHHRRKTAKEFSSQCPACGGRDRFLFWPDKGNYLCRQCGAKGFVSDAPGSTLDREEQLARAAAEAEKERARRKAVLDELARRADTAAYYHHLMSDRSYWYGQGLNDVTIDKHQLGWCPRCPTFLQSPSWTIPVTFRDRLLNIRHRLICPPSPGDKYRPEMAGAGAMIFNGDLLDQTEKNPVLMVVEGEIKAMVLTQRGFPAIGVPGASSFKPAWAHWLAAFAEVIVCFDPGAEVQAAKTAGIIGQTAKVMTLPVKPDDFFVVYGGTVEQFQRWVSRAV